MKKPDCYKCKHRGDIPGSAHSCCKHPSISDAIDDPMAQMLSILGSVERIPPIGLKGNPLGVTGNERGIKGGWFQYPWNFDPVWLESCNGFEKEQICKQ